jgi:ABC-type antimicrobial peptide transport system permease subunit
VGLTLLIVFVNLLNLLLARDATRRKEFAVRSALGTGRGRLSRQMLTASLVLSSAGVLLGLYSPSPPPISAHLGSIARSPC